MKTLKRIAPVLRATALAVLVGGLGVWAASGARIGWTQTSTVRLQTDEVTGIEYPVRQPGFVAGVEIPLFATATAVVLAGLSLVGRRPVTVNS